MNKLPVSNNAVYANGSAVSTDMSMADYKAKLFAYGKICMAAGGKVNQQSKIFMQDTAVASTEISELAIKSMCPSVDITGVRSKKSNALLKADVSVVMCWLPCPQVKPMPCNAVKIS
jgi:hypothetical protein